MGDIPTIAIKKGDNDYKIINESDFDPAKGHVKYEGVLPRDTVTTLAKNPDGTYPEPTPTDVRYPNKDKTEFANNHGATIGKNAAEMREAADMDDAPGGLAPDPVLADAVKAKEEAEKKSREEDAKKRADVAKKESATKK